MAPPAPATRAVPPRRARVLGALEIALAIDIAAFWVAFFVLGARAIADPPHERVYLVQRAAVGLYAAGLPQALGNAFVNGACVAGGAAVVAGAGMADRGAASAGSSRRGAWRSGARVRQDGAVDGAA